MIKCISPTWGPINTTRPLFILQTNNRFNDSDENFGEQCDPRDAARRHGCEAVRVWNETIPDTIKPFCHLQIELRMQDHRERYERLRRLFEPLQTAGVPVNFQFADPHDRYVFEPDCVKQLLEEFSCIQSLTLTEINYEHYRSFNVARYAVSPEARYTMDVIALAAKHGKYISISLQGLKWMHICADILNAPLFECIREHGDYVLAVNEHIGPQHLPRQTSVWGLWLAGVTRHWGVEPQSWWFENGRMIRPGVFGQYQASNTRIMPPPLYRAMILQGALLGATVYQFEPFWDLFDYDNSQCWHEVICPTLKEIVDENMISTREQCLAKTRVAYQYKHARDINEFHENLRDVDFIHDEGLLSRAAYGVWEKFMEHELIPNKSRYFFIPLLPPVTPQSVLNRFPLVLRPGECASEAEYESLLNRHYPDEPVGTAWTTSINNHTYVMQHHENLYEEQSYSVPLPRAVCGLTGKVTDEGLLLKWSDSPVASKWKVLRSHDDTTPKSVVAEVTEPTYLDAVIQNNARYAVIAETSDMETVSGTVNYLDYLVFSNTVSRIVELLVVDENGVCRTHPVVSSPDERPKSQVVYPTFEGASEHITIAREIVKYIDQFKTAYDTHDYNALIALYADEYEDGNGYHVEYARRAWRWWFLRNNAFCFLRQIRRWDFSDYAKTDVVRVRMFALCRALRRDDMPFGSGYDGTVRIPRTDDEEVIFTWRFREKKGWQIVCTSPALPNFNEILWNNRGADKTRLKLVPGTECEPELLPEGVTNLLPCERDWLPENH